MDSNKTTLVSSKRESLASLFSIEQIISNGGHTRCSRGAKTLGILNHSVISVSVDYLNGCTFSEE